MINDFTLNPANEPILGTALPTQLKPEERTGVGLPYIPLTTEKGKLRSYSPNGFLPPWSCMVVFRTFDGELHNGETVSISNAGEHLRCEVAFFAKVKGKRVIFFVEEVQEWQLRSEERKTDLN